jgi:hypothetical protein
MTIDRIAGEIALACSFFALTDDRAALHDKRATNKLMPDRDCREAA